MMVAAVGALTALALGLRLLGIDQSIFGDETFTYDIVVRPNLGDVVDAVRHTSITPPLHYVVAWIAVQFGDPATTIRLPSVLFGTATVPLLYAVGVRTVGRPAGLIGAGLLAISPFATWYSNEARTYALVSFLLVASAYALLRARDAEGRVWPWWVLFVAMAAGTLYAHYTGVFVLFAEALWALVVFGRRRRMREVVIALVLTTLLYLPWVPAYLDQRKNPGLAVLESFSRVTGRTVWEYPATMLFGQPYASPWWALLGTAGVVLLAAALAAVIAGCVTGWSAVREMLATHREGALLVGLVALATPVGLLLYSLVSSSLYLPRNLSCSLPALYLVLAVLVTWIAPPVRWVATGLLVIAMVIAAVRGLDDDRRRPPTKEVASLVDRLVDSADPVLIADQLSLGDPFRRKPGLRAYTIYMRRHVESINPRDPAFKAFEDRASGHRRWLYIVPGLVGYPTPQDPVGVDLKRFRVVSHRVLKGLAPINVFVLEPRAGSGT
jgi:Dolichyl-phosphate-mannose-protein mannosyltransferase